MNSPLAIFQTKYPKVKFIQESTFKHIKNTPFLDKYMPSNLVWMEKSYRNRRYFSVDPKLVRVSKKTITYSLLEDACRFIKQAVQENIYFQSFKERGALYVDPLDNSLCVMPDKFRFGKVANYNILGHILAPFTNDQVYASKLKEIRNFLKKPKHQGQIEILKQHGFITKNGNVDFDKLRPKFKNFINTIDTVIQMLKDELSSMTGKIIMANTATRDRNQYSLDPKVIAEELKGK